MGLKFKWQRNANISYPKVWLTFQANDIDSDNIVEYRICDLTTDRFEETFQLMVNDYLKHEPINAHLGCGYDNATIQGYRILCQSTVEQKTSVICIKTATDEIVGASILAIISEQDELEKQISENGNIQSAKVRAMCDLFGAVYGDFNVFKQYNVNEYLGSFGLSVTENYWGREIGLKLLQTRKIMGEEFGVKIAHSGFSSNYSNPIAEKVGYKIDAQKSYEELAKLGPRFDFTNVGHDRLTVRTWIF